MKTFRLTVYSTSCDSQGDIITRHYTVRAADWDEAMYFSTMFAVVPGNTDNVIDWAAEELS